jgi:hypothetical protein
MTEEHRHTDSIAPGSRYSTIATRACRWRHQLVKPILYSRRDKMEETSQIQVRLTREVII